VDDVLTYALFPQVGLRFLENRGNPEAFEPAPNGDLSKPDTNTDRSRQAASDGRATYTVEVEGARYVVAVTAGGEITQLEPKGAPSPSPSPSAPPAPSAEGQPLVAPLAGTIIAVRVTPDQSVS